jgi:hypothetical protein
MDTHSQTVCHQKKAEAMHSRDRRGVIAETASYWLDRIVIEWISTNDVDREPI